jgi:ribosomal protein L44E
MGITDKQKEALREMVEFKCEECNKNESEVGTLEPHRIRRGNIGGEYIPRNIKMICNKCHKAYHAGEFR